MSNEMEILQGQKILRRGYTTGSTATAAAALSISLLAEALGDEGRMLLQKEVVEGGKEPLIYLSIQTPSGIRPRVEIQSYEVINAMEDPIGITRAIKDGGDDPDVTHQGIIQAKAYFGQIDVPLGEEEPIPYAYHVNLKTLDIEPSRWVEPSKEGWGRIYLVGGKGVGRVTKKGLAPTLGHSAINPTPRAMIIQEIAHVLEYAKELQARLSQEPLWIEISVEEGEEIAKKTFNPKLGIVGGISILGTTGIVEPMSEKALVDTIKTELNQFKALESTKPLLICPGNYGQGFAKKQLGLDLEKSVKISNFVGEALDYLVHLQIPRVLLVGHGGKLVKIAAGVMNTHSAYADGRQEVMVSHCALCQGKADSLKQMMAAISMEEMLDGLYENEKQVVEDTLHSIGQSIAQHIKHRTKEAIQVEFLVFTNSHGVFIKSPGADQLLSELQEEI